VVDFRFDTDLDPVASHLGEHGAKQYRCLTETGYCILV